MKAIRRPALAIWILLPALLMSGPATAAPEYLRFYKTGLEAVDARNWAQAESMMRKAIELKPEERRRRVVRRSGYFPHYYLGLARYHLSDCSGALASWAESEGQGAIVGREEYQDLLRLQGDCKTNGRPTLGQSAAPSQDLVKEKKTAKEKVRTGQHVIEKGADPTKKALGAVERAAPEGSGVAKVAADGQKYVEVAETATDVVDAFLSPEERLEAAIDAYFVGNPQRTLTLLTDIDMSDPRGRSQVYLFRAAANFRLHLLAGGDSNRLAAARKNADLFQQEQWRKDFPTELFDPRFVQFVRGQE